MTSPISQLQLTRTIAGLFVLVALLVYETVRPFFPFFASGWRMRGMHVARNLGLGLVNVALTAAGFAVLWGMAAAWSKEWGIGLLHRAGLSFWPHAVAAVLMLDVWTYWWHRANHRIAFLWRFHRMHHSDPWMDVSTARRFHPGEIVFSSVLRIPLILLLGIHLWELVLYEAIMAIVVDFHHANIGIPARFDRWLRVIFVTPAMHKVHHSRRQAETDSNYTSLLSVWDRIFRSFRLRPDLSAIRIGLDGWCAAAQQTLRGMLATPIRERPH